MKVSINAGGREVTIEAADANLTHDQVAATALYVWKETASAGRGSAGPAVGFQAERAPQQASARWLGEGPARPVHASSRDGVQHD